MIILITILFFLSGLEHYTCFDWHLNDFGENVLRKIQHSTVNCRVENRPLITTAVLLPFIDSPIIETLARILTPHFLHAEAIEITQSIMSTLHKMSFGAMDFLGKEKNACSTTGLISIVSLWSVNPSTPKILLVILLTVYHTILVMLVRRVWFQMN